MTDWQQPGGDFDKMRLALSQCRFLPAHPHRRFARDMAGLPLGEMTEAQRRHVIRLAWRYRRQLPALLVPSQDAVLALDEAWQAGRTTRV